VLFPIGATVDDFYHPYYDAEDKPGNAELPEESEVVPPCKDYICYHIIACIDIKSWAKVKKSFGLCEKSLFFFVF
jgi:hypothetical protein